jgi:glycine betaine catabolism B
MFTSLLNRLLSFPERLVDAIGMYRLLTLSLGALAFYALVAGYLGVLAYTPYEQLMALGIALSVALATNVVIGYVTKLPLNHESAGITGLILFFIFIPGMTGVDNWPLALAVFVAIVSKFVLVSGRQHFVNPAAFGALALSLPDVFQTSWWVGNPTLAPLLILCGFLVTLKLRKWWLVLSCIGVGLLMYMYEVASLGGALSVQLMHYITSWPTLFLAFFMLTEPFTTPSTKRMQMFYGAVVGALSNTSLLAPIVSMTPELALVLMNIACIPARLHHKLFLVLKEKRTIARDTIEYVFTKPSHFVFEAGQYLEWMLLHATPDNRGIRRYFTIASSPTEDTLRIAMKMPQESSSFKRALGRLSSGQVVTASQRAGDFTLPLQRQNGSSPSQKLGFIAGGIGVTPFRSHLIWMLDTKTYFDVACFYAVNTVEDVAYREVFMNATHAMPWKMVYVVAKPPQNIEEDNTIVTGYLTEEILRTHAPDFLERTWYISGPPPMVATAHAHLRTLGVPRANIIRDFFSGAV